MNKIKFILFGIAISLVLSSCATNKVMRPETQVVIKQEEEYQGLKRKVAIARFSNETEAARSAFYDISRDPLGKQGMEILTTRLAKTGKFILLERNDLDKIQKELEEFGSKDAFQKVGADFLLLGSITEYGRKTTGEEGIVSRSKTQTVQAGVSIRLVDVYTGQIIYSEEAKGQAETTSSTTLGVGGTANFDATLSDKAISAAISKLVENIINNCTDKPWRSFILSNDEAMFIAGGKSQGIKANDIFEIVEKGKQVKNPQTGMMMELPGKAVGKIQIQSTGGDPQNEWSIAAFIEGGLPQGADISNFYVQEIRK
ncbi:MAG: CsgG/HfaB family protein [Fibromonadaceae bacterium]|nr:CsgG/HfaB family protein [Fibromonadaceae bacterium]